MPAKMNPFEVKTKPADRYYMDWQKLYPAGFCSCFDAPAPACRQWRICTLVPGSAPLLSLCPAGGLYRRTML